MSQSLPPSLDQQLADARTAVAVHIQRITELEAVVQAQREEITRLEKELDALALDYVIFKTSRDAAVSDG